MRPSPRGYGDSLKHCSPLKSGTPSENRPIIAQKKNPIIVYYLLHFVLNNLLYVFRPAAAAGEQPYSNLLEGVGFERGLSCGVVFYHKGRDISLVAHGDDFTFCGEDVDLRWVMGKMKSWYEIKVRGLLGPDQGYDKDVVILVRRVRWQEWGIEYEADDCHRKVILDYFGFGEDSKPLVMNGDNEDKEEEWEKEPLGNAEAREFRGCLLYTSPSPRDS